MAHQTGAPPLQDWRTPVTPMDSALHRFADWRAWWPMALEALLWLTLALLAGRVVATLAAAPELQDTAPAPVPRHVHTRATYPGTDPFFPDAAASVATDIAGLTLRGVRLGRSDASAIIADAQGRQAAWRAGDTLAPGITLESVDPGHVVLAARGVRHRLELPAPRATDVPAP